MYVYIPDKGNHVFEGRLVDEMGVLLDGFGSTLKAAGI